MNTLTARPSRAPSLYARSVAVLYHSARVLFLRWPNYTFDDLAALQDNLDGPAFSRAAAQMWESHEGRRLLQSRSLLRVRDANWVYFSRLPIDSFGYNVWHHFYVNGLIEELELQPSRLRWDEDTEYAKQRYRATHDMRHVMLGLGVEVHEEVSLQVFQFAQLAQKLSALVIFFGTLKLLFLDRSWNKLVRYLPRAWRSGKRGAILHTIDYAQLWERPMSEIRQHYGITAVGTRYPVAERHPDAYDFTTPDIPRVRATPTP